MSVAQRDLTNCGLRLRDQTNKPDCSLTLRSSDVHGCCSVFCTEEIHLALLGPHGRARLAYNEQLQQLCGDEEATDRIVDRLPSRMVCPITQAPMVEPVATADGHIYEKFAITQWLDDHDTSPLSSASSASSCGAWAARLCTRAKQEREHMTCVWHSRR